MILVTKRTRFDQLVIMNNKDIIVAQATANGIGAVSMVRLSGEGCISMVNDQFSKNLLKAKTHTLHYGTLKSTAGAAIDDCLVSIFRNPSSYTKEDSVEISSHGSPYIVQAIINTFLQKGARMAHRGEFTMRAFLNGQLDLTQAEAVADLIAADTEKSHQVALQQLRGGYSQKLKELRHELIQLASLLELELDFGEEDVEFAERSQLKSTVEALNAEVTKLLNSYEAGNAIKLGIKTVIAGKPNAGKSTLLNALLQDDRAIVSPQAGTTRDTIEEELILDGVKYILTDTAGLHLSDDQIEKVGIKKAKAKLKLADLVLYVVDSSSLTNLEKLEQEIGGLSFSGKMLLILNKSDLVNKLPIPIELKKIGVPHLICSAMEGNNIKALKSKMSQMVITEQITDSAILTNQRHYDALHKTREAITHVKAGLESGLSGDLLAIHIRDSLHQIGLITGEISTDDLLENIFSSFCIGK